MVKRGWVINAGGDAEIAGAIQSGMLAVRRTDTSKEFARMAIKEGRDRRYWQEKIDTAEAVYGRNPRNIAYRTFWGIVELVCYGVNAAYCRLSAMNRSA